MKQLIIVEKEKFQKLVAKGHKKKKKRLIARGGNKYKVSGYKTPNMNRAKSAPPLGEAVLDVYTTSFKLMARRDGLEKYEYENKIRSIAGVTVVSVEPGTGRKTEEYHYDVFNIKFCCEPVVTLSPRSYVKRVLRDKINAISGLHIQKFLTRVRKL